MSIFNPGEIELFIGLLAMGAAVNYAMWSKLRVTFFRQDVFAIRDALWDRARIGGFLSDDRYREARRRLNALIQSASLISIEMVDLPVPEPAPLPHASNDTIKNECDAALSKAGQRVNTFVLYEQATGLFALMRGHTSRQVHRLAVAMVRSTLPESVGVVKHQVSMPLMREALT